MPEIVQSNFVDIDVIDDDAALYRFNHAEERDGQGRLAGARATHHSHLRASRFRLVLHVLLSTKRTLYLYSIDQLYNALFQ